MKIDGIVNFFKGVWVVLNSRIFVIILIVGLALISLSWYQKIVELKTDITHHEQNASAFTDSLTIERNEKGELTTSIDGYIAGEKELKDLNKKLYDQVKGQKGEILSLTNSVIQIKQDSTDLAKTIDELNVTIGAFQEIGNNKYVASWSIPHKFDNNNFFTVNGSTEVQVTGFDPYIINHDTTYLTNFTNQINITYGQKVENKKLRIFIQSKYPGFSVKSMEGVLIDPNDWPSIFKPKKRHWFTGFGVGPNISIGRGLISGNPELILGIGLQYNVYEW